MESGGKDALGQKEFRYLIMHDVIAVKLCGGKALAAIDRSSGLFSQREFLLSHWLPSIHAVTEHRSRKKRYMPSEIAAHNPTKLHSREMISMLNRVLTPAPISMVAYLSQANNPLRMTPVK